MQLFSRDPYVKLIRSLAKEIRNRSARGSFDGARVIGDSERVLSKYPNVADLGPKAKPELQDDYMEITRYVSKLKRSQTGRIPRA